jgi:hypothetical protein
MIVLEQFKNLPILLFSVRYMEQTQGPGGGIGARGVSYTGSVNKETGKVIWWPVDPRPSNGNAQFYSFEVNVRAGTINMIGYTGTVQHYVDDGRKRPEDADVMAPGSRPGFGPDGGLGGPGGFRPGGLGPGGGPGVPGMPGAGAKPLPGRGIRIMPAPGGPPGAVPPGGGGAMLPAPPRLEVAPVPPPPAIERRPLRRPADR